MVVKWWFGGGEIVVGLWFGGGVVVRVRVK